MAGTLSQIWYLARLFGLRKLVRRFRRHQRALRYYRGYAVTEALWALLETGFLDELAAHPEGMTLAEAQTRYRFHPRVFASLVDYLDVLSILRCEGDRVRLDEEGKLLLAEPRGSFDLARGYEPIFRNLSAMLRGEALFGREVFRRGDYVAKGSGELGSQLPFPVLKRMILDAGAREVLDLGCGDLEFLFGIAEGTQIVCHGIDMDADAVRHACGRLQGSPLRDRVSVEQADMFDVATLAQRFGGVDVLTAVDVFHEHLADGTGRIGKLLGDLRGSFNARLAVAEFCRQPHEALRKRPTGFAEHHLFHNLTNQVILSADEWRRIFRNAGYEIEQERVIDLVGHGYFLLHR
ncbi:MAG: methyltransferase domain-containing protein [Planctomycetota bacterium]